MSEHKFPHVSRVEVIDATGRAFVRRHAPAKSRYGMPFGVYIQIQDDGRTLKIFAAEPADE